MLRRQKGQKRPFENHSTTRFEPRFPGTARTEFVGFERTDVLTTIVAFADLGDGTFQSDRVAEPPLEAPLMPAPGAGARAELTPHRRFADLAGVRGDALAKLSEAERAPWKKLWDDVDALLAAVSAPETKR